MARTQEAIWREDYETGKLSQGKEKGGHRKLEFSSLGFNLRVLEDMIYIFKDGR